MNSIITEQKKRKSLNSLSLYTIKTMKAKTKYIDYQTITNTLLNVLRLLLKYIKIKTNKSRKKNVK